MAVDDRVSWGWSLATASTGIVFLVLLAVAGMHAVRSGLAVA